jgi:type II secretory pathway component PulJ
MSRRNKIIIVALIIIAVVGIYIYRLIYVPVPPQVAITDSAIEQAKKENADMRRRLEELEKQVRQGAKQIKQEEREKVDAMPPDAVAGAIADELRLFLGTD